MKTILSFLLGILTASGCFAQFHSFDSRMASPHTQSEFRSYFFQNIVSVKAASDGLRVTPGNYPLLRYEKNEDLNTEKSIGDRTDVVVTVNWGESIMFWGEGFKLRLKPGPEELAKEAFQISKPYFIQNPKTGEVSSGSNSAILLFLKTRNASPGGDSIGLYFVNNIVEAREILNRYKGFFPPLDGAKPVNAQGLPGVEATNAGGAAGVANKADVEREKPFELLFWCSPIVLIIFGGLVVYLRR